MNKILVTTSWDDGHAFDPKLARLLDAYGLKGTFYVSRYFKGTESLPEEEIKRLAARHEIGAHTLTHPKLTKIPDESALKEMTGSKAWLEGVVGREVKMFCYPYGDVDADVAALAAKAGFKGARTTEEFVISRPTDVFRLPTSVQAYPFPFRKKDAGSYAWKRLFDPLTRKLGKIRRLGVPLGSLTGWTRMAKAVFDASLRGGWQFHLFGHSWEIERYGMWKELEEVCRHVGRRQDCRYVTNGELTEGL